MRRADRKTSNDDNANKYTHSRQAESASLHELKVLLSNIRGQRDEWQQRAKEYEKAAHELTNIQQKLQFAQNEVEQNHQLYQQTFCFYQQEQGKAQQNYHLYLTEQQKHQQTRCLYQEEQGKTQSFITLYNQEKAQTTALSAKNEKVAHQLVHIQQTLQLTQKEAFSWENRAEQNHQLYQQTLCLYQEEQGKAQSFITLYNQEKAQTTDLLVKYEEARTQSDHYLSLYNEAQTQLSSERRSKAGIKGWETRRKKENQRLKQEISEMTVLLQESIARKDETVNSLYVLADRMDRIQQLVNSVEEEPINSPINLLQKLKRMWQALTEILGE